MDFTKLNFFKKLNESTPIGLSSLGLTKKNRKKINTKKRNVYPRFFKFDRVSPVAG